MVSRFSLLISCVVGAYIALFVRLYNLQVMNGASYVRQADAQSVSGALLADRGIITFTDKYGKQLPVATNKNFPLVYATPKTIDDAQEVANAVAPILGLDVAAVTKMLAKPKDDYELLKRKASPDAADRIANEHLNGIYVKDQIERYYPFGPLASQLIGFVGPNDIDDGLIGKYGVEVLHNTDLMGTPGEMSKGHLVPPEPGVNIQLTIDPNIQFEAGKVLDDLVAANPGTTGGSVIVQDPKTGKILAMESWPRFDPNAYSDSPLASLLNPAIQKIYEPGSVFKVLTMAAGIDAGKLTPNTTYYDAGTATISGRTISNYDYKTHGPYGTATMTNVIEHSINTGAAFAEARTGNAVFAEYMKKFGFSEKTGVDLPGELAGNLRQLAPNAPQIAYATASYGQGVAVTPLELLNAMAAIANGGNLMRPYVNSALEPQVLHRVISASTAKQVTGMMISAVDKAGIAKIDGYTLAGKTGTAFIPDFTHGGYQDYVIDSYVGFGPTADPKFIVLVKIDNLPSTALASRIVVPAFHDLAQYLINYYNIPPDRAGANQ